MQNKFKKIITPDFLFLMILILILLGGLIKPIVMPKNVNYYENRAANKLPKLDFQTFLKGDFQDNVELAYADQIPLSAYMKKGYNFINNELKFNVNMLYYSRIDNIYIPLSNGINLFGKDNNLVYKPIDYHEDLDGFNNRIDNINNVVKNNPNLDFYIYFIDKDSENDFEKNTVTDTYEYIKSKIDTNSIAHLGVNDFDTYKDYFYKTDHHWNFKGSYQGYKDIINMIYKDENVLEPIDCICFEKKYSGTKASLSGTAGLFSEDFCAYKFDFKNHITYVDGIEIEYGNQDEYFNGTNEPISYGNFYGSDNAMVKFDFNQPNKDNLLIFGESYDNAINLLLASHFNITYNVDLRNYKEDKFEFSKFIKENKVDKVLLVGNYSFFGTEIFNLER